ncbi:unnamed protein product [Ixodes persulcatus]
MALSMRSGRAFSLKRSANETYVKYKNKCDELQKHLQVPLFDENEAPFAPTIDEMKQAESIFVSNRNHTISFIKSAVRPHQYPDHDLPEVAVLGASNVGKSSLLQAVFHKVPDVRVKVSKKPGHTKTLNFYGVGKKFGLVDMPGYGFRQPKDFSAFASEFLTSRTNLKRTFLVLDGHVGFRNFDQDAVEMFEQLKVPYGLVLTKIDKASDAVILKNLMFVQQLRDKFMSHLCFPQPFLVSSVTMEGIGYLQAFLAYIAGQLQVKGA